MIKQNFIEKILSDTKISAKDLEAIAVSEGPGSYTGLRIGVASAKGLCLALGIPLLAISTTAILANLASSNLDCPQHIIAMIDARRMEVYCAHFLRGGEKIISDAAKIINEDFFKPLENTDGGYIRTDAGGYQVLMNYHGSSLKFRQVSLEDILENRIDPQLLRDRIVLIGAQTPSLNDIFYTPYSSNFITFQCISRAL